MHAYNNRRTIERTIFYKARADISKTVSILNLSVKSTYSVGIFESWLVSQSTTAVAKARREFANPEERKRPPLEAVTKRLMKSVTKDTSVSAIVICKV
jgi:hypothetical protein